MRYDTPIHFYYEQNHNQFDIDTGKHNKDTTTFKQMANVTDLGANKQVAILGKLTQGSKTVRLPFALKRPWSYLTIGDDSKRYKLKSTINVLKGYAMIVGEDLG